jgi:hypothetical protein
MNYEYLLLPRQTFIVLALQVPHLPLFFRAFESRFSTRAGRSADGLPAGVDGLVNRLGGCRA